MLFVSNRDEMRVGEAAREEVKEQRMPASQRGAGGWLGPMSNNRWPKRLTNTGNTRRRGKPQEPLSICGEKGY